MGRATDRLRVIGWNEKENDEILEGFARSVDVADWRKEDVTRKVRMTISKGGLGCSDPQEGYISTLTLEAFMSVPLASRPPSTRS